MASKFIVSQQRRHLTAINSGHILEDVCRSMERTMHRTLVFSWSHEHANRSTEKTSILHAEIARCIVMGLGDFADVFDEVFSVKVEKRTPTEKTTKRQASKTGNQDLCYYSRSTQEIAIAIPIKNPQVSINKNIANYRRNLIGESIESLAAYKDAYIEQLFLVPSSDMNIAKTAKQVTVAPTGLEKLPSYDMGSIPGIKNVLKEEAIQRFRFHKVSYGIDPVALINGTVDEARGRMLASPQLAHNLDREAMRRFFARLLDALVAHAPHLYSTVYDNHPELGAIIR
jgi:hypothetical protein